MKISIQKVAFLSLLAGVLPACHEAGTNQVVREKRTAYVPFEF